MKKTKVLLEGLASFFACFLLHNNLRAYYEGNFALMHHHKWNPEYIDNLMPWGEEIYVNLLVNFLKEEENRMGDSRRRRVNSTKIQPFKFYNPGTSSIKSPVVLAARKNVLAANRLGKTVEGIGSLVKDIETINIRMIKNDKLERGQKDREHRDKEIRQQKMLQKEVQSRKQVREVLVVS